MHTTVSTEQTVETYEEPDEERIEEMLELEEQLIEECRGNEAKESTEKQTEEEEEPETEAGEVTTATIRNVRESSGRLHGYSYITIEFLLDGEMMEDKVSYPDNPQNPEEEINRLCNLCNVETGKVSQLQSKEVPVKRTEDGADLVLPATTTLPARMLFRLWLSAKQFPLPTVSERAKGAMVDGTVVAIYLYGLCAVTGVIPVPSESLLYGVAVAFHMIVGILSGLATLVLIPAVLWAIAEVVHENVWPF